MSEGLRVDLSGLPPQGRVVVGFSGGPDSTALCHWLLGRVPRERLLLAHVNHRLRGRESDRDEAVVSQFARQFGLPLALHREDVAALARARNMGLEECGRQVRYDFFASLAPGPEDRILTAHHGGDNVETVLLHLCRGTGLGGLCGIPYRRGKILRPLLGATRQEIEAYCARFHLPTVTDSSNLSPAYARNRIRLEVVPALRELNPELVPAVSRMTESLAQIRDFLEGEAARLLQEARCPWGIRAQVLAQAHPALEAAALELWWPGEEPLEKKHVQALSRCLRRGGRVDLPGGRRACCSQGVLALEEAPSEGFCLPVGLGETLLPCGKVLILQEKILPQGAQDRKIHNLLFKNALDYAIITGNLIARSRRPGDRFAPASRGVTKSLKGIFQENKVPLLQRDRMVLLEWNGRPVFCEGAGPAEGFQVGASTRRALVVSLREAKDF